MLKTNILFIINPISGGKKKQQLPALIDVCLDRAKFKPSYRFTTHIGHAAEIAEEAITEDFDVIVAVGGDGTINEVAAKVMQANKILGIIPFGSGNGFARSLKIPMNTKKAVQVINKFQQEVIDCAKLNDKYFFNMAGVGFDARISSAFANNKSRGLMGYIEMGLKEVFNYQAQHYQLEIDNVPYAKDAFIISIANSSQYGNNIHISPKSSLTDGVLEVCIVKPFPLYQLPILALQMLRAKTHRSKMVEIIEGKEIKITRTKDDAVHVDGEPFLMGKELMITIIPKALTVITN